MRSLRRTDSDDNLHVPVDATAKLPGFTIDLPRSAGSKKCLYEKFPGLQSVIQRTAFLHSECRGDQGEVSWPDLLSTFREEFRLAVEAGVADLPGKCPSEPFTWTVKRIIGAKTGATGSRESKRVDPDELAAFYAAVDRKRTEHDIPACLTIVFDETFFF